MQTYAFSLSLSPLKGIAMIAKKLVKEVPVITMETPGIVAMSLMDELKLTNLPVIDGKACLGVISEAMLYAMSNPELSLAEGEIKLENITTPEGQHLYEITQLFVENQLSLLPVVDEHRHYTGCIHLCDIVKSFGEFASVCEPGGIIVLEIAERDYSLQEIAGIVESNDARILSVQTATQPDSTRMEVTLKINKMDLRPVLQTFARYNYTVSASFQETEYEDSLKERYDSLMNYLKL
jgi:acetoin utilization protein AcuB